LKAIGLNSFGVRLFMYMGLLVLMTVAGTAYQQTATSLSFQRQQLQDAAQQQAERTAAQVKNSVDSWRGQLTAALPRLKASAAAAATPPKKGQPAPTTVQDLLKDFVDGNPDFIAAQLVTANAKGSRVAALGEAATANTSEARFEDKVPGPLLKKLQVEARRWLKTTIPNLKRDAIAFGSLGSKLDLPVVVVAARLEPTGGEITWGIVAVWGSTLVDALPRGKTVASLIVDRKGRVFSSPTAADMTSTKSPAPPVLLKSAFAASAPVGVEADYRGPDGRRRIGAYARMPRLDLAVLVDTDVEAAHQAARDNLGYGALWIIFFLLFAVLFSYLVTADLSQALKDVSQAASRMASGDFKYQVAPARTTELARLGSAFNAMAAKLAEHINSNMEKARGEKELETSRAAQSTLFPRRTFRSEAMSVSGFYQPSTKCGGDLWGHHEIAPGLDLVFIGDAMGQGAPTALVSAVCYATALAHAQGPDAGSPGKLLERLNRIVLEATHGAISVTFFAAVLDQKRAQITYANAGHNFPVILPSKADDKRSGRPTAAMRRNNGIVPVGLRLKGNPLGIDAKGRYEERTLALQPGDRLVLFSDGLIECSSPQGGVWGRKFLMEQLSETSALSAEHQKDELLSRAFSFYGSKPLEDDVTLVMIEVDRAADGSVVVRSERSLDQPPIVLMPAPPPSAVSAEVPAAARRPGPMPPLPTPTPAPTATPTPASASTPAPTPAAASAPTPTPTPATLSPAAAAILASIPGLSPNPAPTPSSTPISTPPLTPRTTARASTSSDAPITAPAPASTPSPAAAIDPSTPPQPLTPATFFDTTATAAPLSPLPSDIATLDPQPLDAAISGSPFMLDLSTDEPGAEPSTEPSAVVTPPDDAVVAPIFQLDGIETTSDDGTYEETQSAGFVPIAGIEEPAPPSKPADARGTKPPPPVAPKASTPASAEPAPEAQPESASDAGRGPKPSLVSPTAPGLGSRTPAPGGRFKIKLPSTG
jgi:serine phosphatase RsbU (regulator of sigma subunit)